MLDDGDLVVLLAELLDRLHARADEDAVRVGVALELRPARAVGEDLEHFLVVIDRERLVTGAEVEDLASAAMPDGAAAEDLATLEP